MRINRSITFKLSAATALLMFCALATQAQWVTQTNQLAPGWNAVYLHVDASHADLNEMIGNDPSNPIEEIWLWRAPLSTGQFIESPQLPTGSGSQWITWDRLLGPASDLHALEGNAAYLVRAGGSSPYNWKVKGKPVTPTYRWTLTGLNFLGFPTPPDTPPSFESFLTPAPELQQNGEIYRYQGGDLDANNPLRVSAFRNTQVRRDQAYWIRAGESYNEYFGPIRLVQTGNAGIRFGDAGGQSRLRLRNTANVPVAVTLNQVASEEAPAGQPTVQGAPPLLLRGPINTTNLTFSYTELSAGPQQWRLEPEGQPGSEVDVVIGLNRSQMSGDPGDFFAGVLRFTDSLGLSQVDVPVSAKMASAAGLWVGGASVASVHHFLKPFARATNKVDFTNLLVRLGLEEGANGYHYEWATNTGRVLVFNTLENRFGSYLLDGSTLTNKGSVARPFPLRLIVHNDGVNDPLLLQKVYYGVSRGSNPILSRKQEALHPSHLQEARRISAVHLPTSAGNAGWPFTTGGMVQGGMITATVGLSFDDQTSNPFLHTYHPDHDNLNPLFQGIQDQGVESYGAERDITLSFTTPEDDFDSLTGGSQDFTGNYSETVRFLAGGSHVQEYNVLGSFSLKRVSNIAELTP